MKTRINIASQIYTGLILQDLQASIKNPMINAQRALLFADALLVCAAPSSQGDRPDCSVEIEVKSRAHDGEQAILVRAAKAKFASELERRRGRDQPSVH